MSNRYNIFYFSDLLPSGGFRLFPKWPMIEPLLGEGLEDDGTEELDVV